MNIFERAGFSWSGLGRQSLVSLLSLALLFATWPQEALAYQDTQDQAPAQATQQAPPGSSAQAPPYTQQTPAQLQQLVAPIALYPDSLVAQVLAASTFPEQVVEADRWVQANPDLKGDALGKAVDQQPWDPSVKALAAFPSVLGNMDKNLSWTSSLGDAYYNQQQDVMDAVQVMRKRAEDAGNLKTTPQQTVTTQGSTVVIQPASPDVVYVPAYDPWLVYGGPVYPWPGWYAYPGIWFGGPYLSFGLGFGIGWFGGFGWGWGHWGFDWHSGYPIYGGRRYYSVSRTFYNRNNFYRGGGGRGGFNGARGGFNGARGGFNGGRGGVYNQHGAVPRPFNGNSQAARGYADRGNTQADRGSSERGNTQADRGYADRSGQSGVRSNAFSGYDHGGEARSFSSRGSSSFGGGGGFHGGGGGGFHGGGGGGGRR